MQFQLNSQAIEHIKHLLALVDIPETQKQQIEQNLTKSSEHELIVLAEKLQVIREWEILEELDNEFSEVQEHFSEWVTNMKKGLIDEKTTEQLQEEAIRIEQILKHIEEHKKQQ